MDRSQIWGDVRSLTQNPKNMDWDALTVLLDEAYSNNSDFVVSEILPYLKSLFTQSPASYRPCPSEWEDTPLNALCNARSGKKTMAMFDSLEHLELAAEEHDFLEVVPDGVMAQLLTLDLDLEAPLSKESLQKLALAQSLKALTVYTDEISWVRPFHVLRNLEHLIIYGCHDSDSYALLMHKFPALKTLRLPSDSRVFMLEHLVGSPSQNTLVGLDTPVGSQGFDFSVFPNLRNLTLACDSDVPIKLPPHLHILGLSSFIPWSICKDPAFKGVKHMPIHFSHIQARDLRRLQKRVGSPKNLEVTILGSNVDQKTCPKFKPWNVWEDPEWGRHGFYREGGQDLLLKPYYANYPPIQG